MKNYSDWAVLYCDNCHRVFAVPSLVIGEDSEDYFKSLTCPYCDKEIEINDSFKSHQSMDIGVKRISKYELE